MLLQRTLLLGVLLVAGMAYPLSPVAAVEPQQPSSQANGQQSQDSRGQNEIGYARVVTLRFSDYPQLNGDYRLSETKEISIPVLGRISADGLTAAELEQAIAKKVSAVTGRRSYVTVEVSEYRPVFLAGLVNRPGPIPWQPDLTAAQAVALAGGVRTGSSDATRNAVIIDNVKRDLATLARVKAELNDATKIEPPAPLVSFVGEQEAKRLIEDEQRLMDDRRSLQQNQLKVLERSKDLGKSELESLKVQRSKAQENAALAREHSANVQQLLSKGLAVNDRLLEERLKVTGLEEKEANLTVAIVRIQAAIAQYDKEAVNLVEARRADLMMESQKLERTIAQNKLELQSNKATGPSSGDSSALLYKIARANSEEDIDGKGSTRLYPGDVLTVEWNAAQ